VRDQKSCGSCWAFATAAALESATLIKNIIPSYNLDTSEQVLVSCGGAGSCGGGYRNSASDYIRNKGLPFVTIGGNTFTVAQKAMKKLPHEPIIKKKEIYVP
jgi:hypothetical protein